MMGKKAKQKFESTGINEMGTIKKMIYSIVSKENATDILIMGDCLFYTIQYIIANIYTLLTRQSFLSVKANIFLAAINFLILFLVFFAIKSMITHDFTKKSKLVDHKVKSYILSQAYGKEFYTIKTNDGAKVVEKDKVEVVHAEVATDDKRKIGTTKIKYFELEIPDGLPEDQLYAFKEIIKHNKNTSMLVVTKYVKDEAKD
ncbi:hypothetical protein B6U39_09295 [Ligilactobacillus salivarius]|uniref:Uncharacterized protein n=2 Tax=Ligilactobacillus salivarius TaxID=1624 RepID=A0AAX3X7W3_9LACO|nr:hypothetical protein [Ligilactobacillus salivarius]OQR18792.1 hypothetical protein B6U39_09295 [Ligilactobacillus salivarius]WII29738.1 hypothetical protein QFE45_10750 [Ligilactobacillus salivarius]